MLVQASAFFSPPLRKLMKTPKLARAEKRNIAIKATHEEISCRAYALYELEGKAEGKALEHWFNAESMSESQFGYGRSHTEHDFSQDTQEDKSDDNYDRGFRKPSVTSKAPKSIREPKLL